MDIDSDSETQNDIAQLEAALQTSKTDLQLETAVQSSDAEGDVKTQNHVAQLDAIPYLEYGQTIVPLEATLQSDMDARNDDAQLNAVLNVSNAVTLQSTDADSDSDTQNDILQLEAALQSSYGETSFTDVVQGSDKSPAFYNLSAALALNKKVDDMFYKIQVKLSDQLLKCTEKLKNVRQLIKESQENPADNGKLTQFSYYQCGIPFFKDQVLFPSPPNADTLKLKACGVSNYFHDNVQKPWTPGQKKNLELEILKLVQEKKRKELSYKIKKLQLEISRDNCKLEEIESQENKAELEKCLNETIQNVEKINTKPLSSLVLPLDQNEEFDWDYISLQPAVGHNSNECRSMWRMFLHPSINKKVWSHSEEKRLNALILQYQPQNWDRLAKLLGTQRSAYQCFLFYRLHLSRDSRPCMKWTSEDDDYLRCVVENCRVGDFIPWAKVAYYVENRTKDQIYNRWIYRLSKGRHGRFTSEEDGVIVTAVKEFGRNFNRIAKMLPDRSPMQVRCRYRSIEFYKNQTFSMWSLKEDKLLLNLVSKARYHSEEINFHSLTKYFTNKLPNSLRVRLRTLESWLHNNPDKNLSMAPRRRNYFSHYSHSKLTLNEALEKLKAQINSTKHKTVRKQQLNRAAVRDINSKLLNYFKEKLVSKKISNPVLGTDPVKLALLKPILLLLGAKLDKQLLNSKLFQEQCPDVKQIAEDLLNSENNINVVKIKTVKTYSRKNNNTSTITRHVGNPISPSIWIDKSEKNCTPSGSSMDSLVMPPCFNTVLAFKTLMLHKLNISDSLQSRFIEFKANSKFESNLATWRTRFETLFTWPAHLSNIPPSIKGNLFENNDDFPISCVDDFEDNNSKLTSIDEMVKKNENPYIVANMRGWMKQCKDASQQKPSQVMKKKPLMSVNLKTSNIKHMTPLVACSKNKKKLDINKKEIINTAEVKKSKKKLCIEIKESSSIGKGNKELNKVPSVPVEKDKNEVSIVKNNVINVRRSTRTLKSK